MGGIKRGTWILGLYARDGSSRRGNCVLKKKKKKKKKNQAHDSQCALGEERMKRYDSHNGLPLLKDVLLSV